MACCFQHAVYRCESIEVHLRAIPHNPPPAVAWTLYGCKRPDDGCPYPEPDIALVAWLKSDPGPALAQCAALLALTPLTPQAARARFDGGDGGSAPASDVRSAARVGAVGVPDRPSLFDARARVACPGTHPEYDYAKLKLPIPPCDIYVG